MANRAERPTEQQIEEAQTALRRSIEQARELTDRAHQLLRKPENSAEHRR